MSDPSIGAITTSAPAPMSSEEPISANPAGDETLVCPSTDGAEPPDEPGARALVERFGGSQGAGGIGEVPEEPKMPGDEPYCHDDALKAVAACGLAVGAAVGTGGTMAVLAGIGCFAAVDSYAECLNSERRASKE